MADDETPRMLAGLYALDKKVGASPFGVVWSGYDVSNGQTVAIKLLRDDEENADSKERLRRQATVLARLTHPHVMTFLGVHQEPGRIAIITEYLRYGTLLHAFRRGWEPSKSDKLRIIMEVLSALAAAHDAGVVHRNVKGSNVFLREDKSAVLGDFGIARVLDAATLPGTREILGAAAYAAPEQLDDPHSVDGRADIYAVGGLVYLLATKRTPPELYVCERQPDMLDGISRAERDLIYTATRKNRDDRYPDARAMAIKVAESVDILRAVEGKPLIGANWIARFDQLRMRARLSLA